MPLPFIVLWFFGYPVSTVRVIRAYQPVERGCITRNSLIGAKDEWKRRSVNFSQIHPRVSLCHCYVYFCCNNFGLALGSRSRRMLPYQYFCSLRLSLYCNALSNGLSLDCYFYSTNFNYLARCVSFVLMVGIGLLFH